MWYRGLPVKSAEGAGVNQDAMAFLVGVQLPKISVGYSYDYTISRLTNLNSLGAHEISITYHFTAKERGPNKGSGYPPVRCPNPWKKFERLNYKHLRN